VKNITDVNQRRAMAFAIDRTAIVKYITQAVRFRRGLHACRHLGRP
jgi:ABC-type transport system substrate-binding protein